MPGRGGSRGQPQRRPTRAYNDLLVWVFTEEFGCEPGLAWAFVSPRKSLWIQARARQDGRGTPEPPPSPEAICISASEQELGSQPTDVPTAPPLLPGCVTSGKVFNFSVPHP